MPEVWLDSTLVCPLCTSTLQYPANFDAEHPPRYKCDLCGFQTRFDRRKRKWIPSPPHNSAGHPLEGHFSEPPY